MLVNYIREYQIEQGVAEADAYTITMYIMASLLVVGFVCNFFMRPVHERHHMMHEEIDQDFKEHKGPEEDLDLDLDAAPAVPRAASSGLGHISYSQRRKV